MANLSSINFKNNKIFVGLEVSKEEYILFKNENDLLVLPISSFDFTLVTGSLGNSNRIMMPNKILKKHNIKILIKNVPSKILNIKKGKYLVIQLEGAGDIPEFKD